MSARIGVVMCLLAAVSCGCGRPTPVAPTAAVPPEVFVAPVQIREMPEYLDVTGRIDATIVVDIRSRITGYITRVAFRDGQFVTKGDVLYEIDSRPYAAQWEEAKGAVEQLLGERRFVEVQVDRYEKLVAKGAASQQEYDTFKAKLEENTGGLAAARAKEEFARLNVEFCTIRSPVDGQISRTQLQVGNLVNQDQTSLTTVVSIDPIFVYFNVDEPTLVRITKNIRESPASAGSDPQPAAMTVGVGLVDDTSRTYPHRSVVDFLNNQVDKQTATITMRGRLDNPYDPNPARGAPPLFRSGMFARVRLPLGRPAARTLVPEAAVGSIQDRKIVWVVGPDDVASTREVIVGQKLGSWMAVEAADASKPLDAAARIVVRGLQRCREGKPVTPMAAAADTLDLRSLDRVRPTDDPPAVAPAVETKQPEAPPHGLTATAAEPRPPSPTEPLPPPADAPSPPAETTP